VLAVEEDILNGDVIVGELKEKKMQNKVIMDKYDLEKDL
jgi:hypothetical protein